MKIEIEISDDNEATAFPYWLILDPIQNMSLSLHALANQVTGPFFSREAAENYLSCKSYYFSKHANVYCLSGYTSIEYRNAFEKAKSIKEAGV